MIITIIEGGELSLEIARILLLFDHNVNIIRQERDENIDNAVELGVNVIFGSGLDIDVLTKPCVSESDVFISLMDTDLDNLEFCLFIKNNFENKRTITKVNNPKYSKKFERIGMDIAINSVFFDLNPNVSEKGEQ